MEEEGGAGTAFSRAERFLMRLFQGGRGVSGEILFLREEERVSYLSFFTFFSTFAPG